MRKLTKLQLACAAIVALFGVTCASAFNSSKYATTSKLASGKWVKISIPENGVYEITYDELTAMGFSNPAQVKLYGCGGARINEVLNGSAMDDLQKVPILRTGNKICFYGNGPVTFTMTNYSTNPHYTRVFNAYSQVGCYFLTEEADADLTPSRRSPVTLSSYVNQPTSLSYCHHEYEMTSVSGSGKEMLGEDISGGKVMVDYYMPSIASSEVMVQTAIAANVNQMTYASGVIHSGSGHDTTTYTQAASRIYRPTGDYVFYNFATPFAKMTLTDPAERGQFEPMLTYSSPDAEDLTITMARLDYFTLTYTRYNVINEGEDNQIFMGYVSTKGNERFQLPNASSNTVVWYINNTNNPISMTLTPYDDESGKGLYFTANSAATSSYVAFDPAKTLKKIVSFESVENQNLHALSTPDLLIITEKVFHEEAERLADLHRAIDGIDVHVVDQGQVFNEFSSGTRDAMAFRLMCKMFYDRDVEKKKFKNLLIFGPGSFDNRELMGEHPGNLLTYESDNSNYEDFSFVSDDFFGFLDDNSGANISSDILRIGVGRITSADVAEAKSDVDKIVEYYATPDYGVWRNNTMIFSDSPDRGLYMYQGEGYKNMIDNELGTGMHVNTVHNSMYPRSTTEPAKSVERKTSTVGKQLLSKFFKDGVYFASYVGHAGPTAFTKYNNMWVTADVVGTSYPYWPIMSTACCDVAHFDSDSRGIAERMFHKRDGGAIALLTSSRMVYANGNDQLNRYFINALFTRNENGETRTLGEAYMLSKQGFTSGNSNKLSFFLLGDPAIKLNFPVSRFNITKVNNTDMTAQNANAQIGPLVKFNIEARVVDAEGNLDSSFNGDATVTLYDKEELFTTITQTESSVTTDRDIYFNRDKLSEITGRVVNGVFTGEMIVPKSVKAVDENVLLRVYAHKDNTSYMVNGFSKQITMLADGELTPITDDQNPVITGMYINDETTFADGAVVGSNATLYINAIDNEGINLKENSIEHSMSLLLDGGKPSYDDVTCFTETSEGGKGVYIEYPLNNLSEGLHTLTYTVYDLMGNSATRTISFMVGQSGDVTLTADKWPAYQDGEVVFDMESNMTRTPEMILRVTDATGKLMWMTTTSSFPVTWDLKDMNGNKVPAGLYRYFGTYTDGTNSGGTSINKLIVLDPLKTAMR